MEQRDKHLLRNLREEKKISQSMIYQGLCSQPLYSKIEQGEKEVDQMLFYAFLGRLGISQNKYTMFLKKEDICLAEQRKRIEESIEKEEWKQAEQQMEMYKENDFRNVTKKLHEQVIYFFEAKIAYTKGELRTAMEKLKMGIGETNEKLLEVVEGEKTNIRCCVSELELTQLCMLCEIMEKKEEKESAEKIWRWVYEYIVHYIKDTEYKMRFYPVVLYHMTTLYKQKGSLVKALCYCEEGIEFLKTYKSLLCLKELLQMYEKLTKEMKIGGKEEYRQYLSMLEFIETSILNEEKEEQGERRPHLGIYSIHAVIKNTREYEEKTQEELNQNNKKGNGKADPSTLSRIEHGHQNPRKTTCEHYFQQLGLGKYQMENTPVVGEGFYVQELWWNIEHMLNELQFAKAREYVEELKTYIDIDITINEQYIRRVDTVISYYGKKITAEQYRAQLVEELQLTWKEFRLEDKRKLIRFLSRTEIGILINIAQSYKDEKEYDRAIEIYKRLQYYFEEVYPMAGYNSYNLLCYSMEQTLGLSGRYDESIKLAKKGIKINCLHEDSRLLYNHLYNIGWNYGQEISNNKKNIEKEKYKKACQIYLEQALKGAIFMGDKEIVYLVAEQRELYSL